MTDPGVPGVPGMVVDGMPGPPGIVVEGVPGVPGMKVSEVPAVAGMGRHSDADFQSSSLGGLDTRTAAAMAAASNASGCSKSISNCEPLSSKTSLRGDNSTFTVATVAGSATV